MLRGGVMVNSSAADLLASLQQSQILDSTQVGQLGHDVPRRFSTPQALTRELTQRGWLTEMQADRILKGHASELKLGSYLLLECLGQGGMGAVFKARHLRLDRVDALKIINKHYLQNPVAVQRFQREARAAARLHHPNLLTVYDADEDNGTHFLAMEYVEGVDLGKLVSQLGKVPIPEAVEYVRQTALGLQHIHQRGLVHRDIKPANLLVSRVDDSAVVKILDLGLARIRVDEVQASPAEELTQDRVMMGTPDYIAPEQAVDAHSADIRADIYSLGCTFYHLLAGQPPFAGGSLPAKIYSHIQAEPVPVEQSCPGLPVDLIAVVRRMMAKKPDDRFQTPGEVAAALQPYAGDPTLIAKAKALQARNEAAAQASTLTGGAGVPHLSSATTPDAPPVRRLSPVLAVLILLLLGAAGVGLAVLQPWRPANHSAVADARPTAPTTPAAVPDPPVTKPVKPAVDPVIAASQAAHQRALVLARSHDYEKAIQGFTEAISLDKNSAVSYADRGLAYYYLKNYEQAIADCTKAIELDSHLAVPYTTRGRALVQKGEPDEALTNFNEAIRIDPLKAKAFTYRASLFERKRDFEHALADLSEAVRVDPTNALAWYDRALFQSKRRNYEAVVTDCTEAIRLNPNYAHAFNLRGYALRSRGETDRAIPDHDEAIRLDPQYANAYTNRGVAYSLKDDYERAFADCNKGIELEPKMASSYNQRGLIFLRKKDYAKALADFDHSIKLDPKVGVVYLNRSRVYAARGEKEKAAADRAEANRVDPGLAPVPKP